MLNKINPAYKLLIIILLFGVCSLSFGVKGCSGNQNTKDTLSGSSITPTAVSALSEILPNDYQYVESTGKEFTFNNLIFPNLKLTSTEDIHIRLEALPKLQDGVPTDIGGMISIYIDPTTTTSNTQTLITLSGLEPFWKGQSAPIPLYLHQDGYCVSTLNPDSEGKSSWTQDLTISHHVYILPEAHTFYITHNTVLTRDTYTPIVIAASYVTLDGNNYLVRGAGTGTGIYIPQGIINSTIKRCRIENFQVGIVSAESSYYRNTVHTIDSNTISSCLEGIFLYHVWNNIISNNIINAYNFGIDLDNSNYDTFTNNLISNNTSVGIFNWMTNGNIFTGNTLTGNNYGIMFRYCVGTFYHNNIYNNTTYNVFSDTPIELSYNGEGNWWGRTCPGPLFIAGVDSNAGNVVDSYPYRKKDAWLEGIPPGCPVVNQPPQCQLISPVTGTYLTGQINITFTVTDPNNDDVGVTAWIDGINVGGITVTNTAAGTIGTISFNSTVITPGIYSIHIRCDDAKGGIWEKSGLNPFTIVRPNTPPWISPPVPNVTTNEDVATSIDLTGYENDLEDGPAADGNSLVWSITGVNTLLYMASIDPITDLLTIIPMPDANGTSQATLILTDSGGLTAIQNITVTIKAVNDPPQIILISPNGGERWGLQNPTALTNIVYEIYEREGDRLRINFYYSISDRTWFNFDTVTITPPAAMSTTYTYPWNVTNKFLDDYRYKIMVEAIEVDTPEALTATDQSASFFTINNQALTIDPLVPAPQVINPTFGETTLLPLELSEPATVTVEILDPTNITIWTINAGLLTGGIQSVTWNGQGNIGVGNYTFRVTGIDSLGNAVIATSNVTLPVDPAGEFVTIRATRPIIANVLDTPDPIWRTISSSSISYTIFTPDTPAAANDFWTTVTIEDEGGNPVATLLPETLQEGSSTGIPFNVVWDGAQATQNGIFRYTISGGIGSWKINPPPPGVKYKQGPDGMANSVSGVITVIESDTITTVSTDTNVTVYSRPLGVTIDINPTLPSDVTFALQSISGLFAGTNYPVSAFYDIKTTAPITPPAIISFNYSPALSPEEISLFRYNPLTQSFEQVTTAVVDRLNNRIIVEVTTLSLFVLMVNKDKIPPMIEDLSLTHQNLNFTLRDDLSGINVQTISVTVDDKNITDKLTITGKTGDLTVTVSGRDIFQTWLDTHTMRITAHDRTGNEVSKTISFIVGYTQVKLVLKPESLNINPGVLTAYLKFPKPFGVPKILEVTLDYAPSESWMVNYDGVPDLGLEGPVVEVKFRREVIEKVLAEKGMILDTEFILRGRFDDGTALYGQLYNLEGRDSITKIIPEETPATGPPEQSKEKGTKK